MKKRQMSAHTHPGSVALALVAESEDEAYGQNRYDNGKQDTHIVVWLGRWRESQGFKTEHPSPFSATACSQAQGDRSQLESILAVIGRRHDDDTDKSPP